MLPYSALTDYDRSVVLTLDDRPDPQLWGHCRSTHNSSMICFFLCLQWFLFGILAMDGMSERNHCHIIIFSLHCFKGFSVASWRIMQHMDNINQIKLFLYCQKNLIILHVACSLNFFVRHICELIIH